LFKIWFCNLIYSKFYCVFFSESNDALREFLLARNPKQQHSATLESYMIKPIQRILKYPLLLQQLCSQTIPSTDEHHHLTGLLNKYKMFKIFSPMGLFTASVMICPHF
jgi:T-lymphoma invasion and metastasis-inducing protein 1